MAYNWEPVGDTHYPSSVTAESTPGRHYDVLQIEQSNEGWHGLLLDSDGGDLWLLDEEVFLDSDDARDWCENRDLDAATDDEDWDDDEWFDDDLGFELGDDY